MKVVVDCGNGTEPHAMKTFEYATAIFVVTTGDVIVVNQTKRVLAKIQELLFPPEMVQVVINRYNPNHIVNPTIISKNLNRQVFAAIPEDVNTCDSALAKSIPLCIAVPNAPISRAYHDLVRKIQQVNLLENLAKLKQLRPRQPLTIPTGVLADLVAAGVAADTGIAAVLSLASNAGDADYIAFRRNVERDIAQGASPAASVGVRLRAMGDMAAEAPRDLSTGQTGSTAPPRKIKP